MKTLAYLDCVTGISGDMCLGALVHAGVPLDYLKEQLDKLGISNEFSLRAEMVQRNGQAATKVSVDLTHQHRLQDHPSDSLQGHSHGRDRESVHSHAHQHGSRRLPEIAALIEAANLPARASRWSLAVFHRLAQAEAAVHGIPPEQVHFHEVGATDAIVDIAGTCLGLDWLGIDGLICSALPTGGGTVRCEHGLLPVPAPAVLNLMASAQMPVYSNGIERELVTPTGCAIAATLASSFGSLPQFTIKKVGLGAGRRELALPNILRLWIGTVDKLPASMGLDSAGVEDTGAEDTGAEDTGAEDTDAGDVDARRPKEIAGHEAVRHAATEGSTLAAKAIEETARKVVVLQTQIDDLSPQVIGYVFDLLFAAGAVDVFAQSVLMKKNRPGTLLTVLCREEAVGECERILFRETTTLGIRRTEQQRSVLDREMVLIETDYGPVMVKVGRLAGAVANVQPEFEDCARQARSHRIPLQQVQRAAIAAAASLWL